MVDMTDEQRAEDIRSCLAIINRHAEYLGAQGYNVSLTFDGGTKGKVIEISKKIKL